MLKECTSCGDEILIDDACADGGLIQCDCGKVWQVVYEPDPELLDPCGDMGVCDCCDHADECPGAG